MARKACRFALALAGHFIHQSGYPSEAPVFAGPGSVGAREWKEGDWRVVSDEEIETYIGMYIGSEFHFSSSCRMGREEEGGVVDSQLRSTCPWLQEPENQGCECPTLCSPGTSHGAYLHDI